MNTYTGKTDYLGYPLCEHDVPAHLESDQSELFATGINPDCVYCAPAPDEKLEVTAVSTVGRIRNGHVCKDDLTCCYNFDRLPIGEWAVGIPNYDLKALDL